MLCTVQSLPKLNTVTKFFHRAEFFLWPVRNFQIVLIDNKKGTFCSFVSFFYPYFFFLFRSCCHWYTIVWWPYVRGNFGHHDHSVGKILDPLISPNEFNFQQISEILLVVNVGFYLFFCYYRHLHNFIGSLISTIEMFEIQTKFGLQKLFKTVVSTRSGFRWSFWIGNYFFHLRQVDYYFVLFFVFVTFYISYFLFLKIQLKIAYAHQ